MDFVLLAYHRIKLSIQFKEEGKNAQGLSALTIVTAFKSYHKLIKIQLQYLDQSSASKPWLKTA